jgi:hypothetical protein
MLKVRRIHDLDVGYPVNMIYLKDKQLSKSALDSLGRAGALDEAEKMAD